MVEIRNMCICLNAIIVSVDIHLYLSPLWSKKKSLL